MPEKYIRLIQDNHVGRPDPTRSGCKTVTTQCSRGEQQLWVDVGLHQSSIPSIPVPTSDGCVDTGCEKLRTYLD